MALWDVELGKRRKAANMHTAWAHGLDCPSLDAWQTRAGFLTVISITATHPRSLGNRLPYTPRKNRLKRKRKGSGLNSYLGSRKNFLVAHKLSSAALFKNITVVLNTSELKSGTHLICLAAQCASLGVAQHHPGDPRIHKHVRAVEMSGKARSCAESHIRI